MYLSEMDQDKEYQRLCNVFAAQDDDQLLHIAETRESFTPLAQEAIAKVMNDRGLEIPATIPPTWRVPDHTEPNANPEEAPLIADDEEGLWVTSDSFAASAAARTLEAADIPFRIVDMGSFGDDSYKRSDFGLVVKKVDAIAAISVLQKHVGSFPKTSDDAINLNLGPLEDFTLLAMFDRPKGVVAAQALGEAGISYIWHDGKEETTDLPDEETVTIEVRTSQLDRATKLTEDRLAS